MEKVPMTEGSYQKLDEEIKKVVGDVMEGIISSIEKEEEKLEKPVEKPAKAIEEEEKKER